MQLQGRAAIVTGAAHGIGRAIAQRFAREGARVVVADINGEGAAETVARIEAAGGEALAITADVGRRTDWERTVQECLSAFGRLDVLVNNAGIGGGGAIDQTTEEEFDQVVDCNLRGTWLGCHYSVPHMKRQGGGVILSISSVQGIAGWPDAAVYGATKAGILGMTRALAVELAPFSIRVNAICPGAIHVSTPEERIAERLGPEYVEEFQRRFGARLAGASYFVQPLPRHGVPEDIASAALFLCSDEARFITGATLVVDGGMTAAHYERPREDSHASTVWQEVRAWVKEVEAQRQHPPE